MNGHRVCDRSVSQLYKEGSIFCENIVRLYSTNKDLLTRSLGERGGSLIQCRLLSARKDIFSCWPQDREVFVPANTSFKVLTSLPSAQLASLSIEVFPVGVDMIVLEEQV